MAQVSYRANLSAAEFPMTIAESGRTVIVPGPDNNYDRRLDPSGEQKDAGIPQALFLENVIPTQRGYQSVGYIDSSFTLPIPAGEYLLQAVEVKGLGLTTIKIFTIPLFFYSDLTFTSGKFGQTVVSVTGTNPDGRGKISIAQVLGTCYMYCEIGRQLFEVTYDDQIDTLYLNNITATVTPAGFFTTNGVKCIAGSSNYLVASNLNTIFWSSTTTATDFVASLATGAGEEQPNETDSLIDYLRTAQGGFYIYTKTNILYTQYTGNSRYPWKFLPVVNTNAIQYAQFQTYGDATTSAHLAIETENQIKEIAGRESSPIMPALTDYLTRIREHSVFDYTTNIFTDEIVNSIQPRIYVHLNRFVLISINGSGEFDPISDPQNTFSHVIVYDMTLRRYGRLKINHKSLFTVRNLSPELTENIVFVETGTNQLKILHFDVTEQTSLPAGMTYISQQGVFVLGKLQYVRSRMLRLELIDIENTRVSSINPTRNFELFVLPSLDGRNFDSPVTPTETYNAGAVTKYATHVTGINHSLLCKGSFSLSTIECVFNTAGQY